MDGLLTKRDTPPSQGVKLVNQLDSQRMYNNYYYANVLSLVRDMLKIRMQGNVRHSSHLKIC